MPSVVELMPDGIIRVTSIGDQSAVDVKTASAETDRLAREHHLSQLKYLVDFSRLGTVRPDARQALRERIKNLEQKTSARYAIVGMNPAASGLLQLFIKAIRPRSKIKFFKTEEEAIPWLSESTGALS